MKLQNGKVEGGVRRMNDVEEERPQRYRLDDQAIMAGLANNPHLGGHKRDRVGGDGVGDGEDLPSRKKEKDDEQYARWQQRVNMKLQANRGMANLETLRKEAVIEMQNSLAKLKNNGIRKGPHNANDPLNQFSNEVDSQESKQKKQPPWFSRLDGLDTRAQSKAAEGVESKRKLDDRQQHEDKHYPVGFDKNKLPQHSSSYHHLLGGLDVMGYLSAQRMLQGQGDPMHAFQFNQVASDATAPDRKLKDYRNSK